MMMLNVGSHEAADLKRRQSLLGVHWYAPNRHVLPSAAAVQGGIGPYRRLRDKRPPNTLPPVLVYGEL